MEQFAVGIASETPQETRDKLDAAGIPTIGPTYTAWRESPNAEWTPGRSMTAVLWAQTGEGAVQRVREVLGGDCDLGEPRHFGE